MKKAILTDIEGTTTSISFVKDVLFPYARHALPDFVRQHGNEPGVRQWLDAAAIDAGNVCRDSVLVEVLRGWIDEDRKHPALKALQGMIWADGYAQAEYTAHVYADAVASLRAWQAQLEAAIAGIRRTMPDLYELAIGGTAVGTGLNAPPNFGAQK